jgi:hypothetical protein
VRFTLPSVFAIVFGAAPSAFAQAPPPIGQVKVASGTAVVLRAGQSMAVQPGTPLLEADVLRTGPDGRLSVMLNDETRLSLGPGSEVALDRFAFAPAESRFAMVLRLVRGAAAYVSGRIAKLAPDSIRLETPTSIVGVRGTTLVLSTP